MSRNLRHKTTTTPVKKSKRRATNVSVTSDDSDYNGVDNISDSEEDEPDVEEAERRALIEEDPDLPSYDDDLHSPRPGTYSEYENWEGFEQSPVPIEQPFFADHIERGRQPDLASESDALDGPREITWIPRSSDSDSTVTPRTRQVHFEDDGDDSDIERQFPDIFFDQNSLNPTFRNAIEQDDEGHISSDGGRWSFGSDDTGSPDENGDESGSLSGYSTDSEGDSWILGDSDLDTDEEETPQHAVAPMHSILRRSDSSSESDSSTSTEEITPARRPRGPRLGTWKHDRTKPFMMYDGVGRKLLMFRGQPRRMDGDGPIMSSTQASPAPTPVEMSPMLSNSANLMMGSMNNGFGRGQIDQFGEGFAPIEAFFPFVSVSNNGVITQDSSSANELDDEDDYLDDENLWNVEDLVDFGGGSSGGEDEDPSPSSDTAEPLSMSTPAQATSVRSEEQVHPLLNHFNNPNVVGAFRNNQARHTLLTRDNQSQDSLAFSSPLQQGTLKGIKGGRFAQANKPITPRRKTLQQPIGSSPGSPLSNVSAMKKRKFGGEDFMGHKRNRSAF